MPQGELPLPLVRRRGVLLRASQWRALRREPVQQVREPVQRVREPVPALQEQVRAPQEQALREQALLEQEQEQALLEQEPVLQEQALRALLQALSGKPEQRRAKLPVPAFLSVRC